MEALLDAPEEVIAEEAIAEEVIAEEAIAEEVPEPFNGPVIIRKGPSAGVNFVIYNGKMVGMVASFNRFNTGTKWFIPGAVTLGTKMNLQYENRTSAIIDLINRVKEKEIIMARKKAEAKVADAVASNDADKLASAEQLLAQNGEDAVLTAQSTTAEEVQDAENAGEQDAVQSEIDNLIKQVGIPPEGTVVSGRKAKGDRPAKVAGTPKVRDKVYLILHNIPGFPEGFTEHDSLTGAYENAQKIVSDLKAQGIILKRGGDRGWDRTWTLDAVVAAPAEGDKPAVNAQPDRAIYYSKVNPNGSVEPSPSSESEPEPEPESENEPESEAVPSTYDSSTEQDTGESTESLVNEEESGTAVPVDEDD
jgi:hypothetical protein